MVLLSLCFRFGCGHTSDDPRPKQETDQCPCPAGGSGIGPGYLLTLEIDRRNLHGSGETRIAKYVVPESFLLEQGHFSSTIRETMFWPRIEVVGRTTAKMSGCSGDGKNLGIIRFRGLLQPL